MRSFLRTIARLWRCTLLPADYSSPTNILTMAASAVMWTSFIQGWKSWEGTSSCCFPCNPQNRERLPNGSSGKCAIQIRIGSCFSCNWPCPCKLSKLQQQWRKVEICTSRVDGAMGFEKLPQEKIMRDVVGIWHVFCFYSTRKCVHPSDSLAQDVIFRSQ